MVFTMIFLKRFRGRYFLYAESGHGGIVYFGTQLVEQIPTDCEQYKGQLIPPISSEHSGRLTHSYLEWLENQRALYAEMTAELESKVLTITEETIQTYGSKDEEFVSWQMVDNRLMSIPSALYSKGRFKSQCAFILDLDREIFSVDMWIHFSMKNIPRDRWFDGLHGVRSLPQDYYLDICPEATIGLPKVEYFADDCSRDEYWSKYQQYDCSIVKAKSKIEHPFKAAHRQVIAVVTFERFVREYSDMFRDCLPELSHDDFAFRELAFAILSFATCQYRLDMPHRLHGELINGYLIDPDDDISHGKSKLLPLFAQGCHSPEKEPGSAPQASIYWFESVLVSLVPDIILQNDAGAAIAKVVGFGLGQGKLDFHAIALSVINVIMLRVIVENGVTIVKHTKTTRLSTPPTQFGEYPDVLEAYCWRQKGFVSLMHFFNAAANRHLSVFGQGCFPTEIYMNILANTNEFTYNTCAKVSRTLREVHRENIHFCGKTITKFSAEPYNRQGLWIFTIRDRDDGSIKEYRLDQPRNVDLPSQMVSDSWCPIIGVARPSLIDRIRLTFVTSPTKALVHGSLMPQNQSTRKHQRLRVPLR
jgi:hypothetical protein